MSEFVCMYQTDKNGKLVHQNAYPEYVEKMYEVNVMRERLVSFYFDLELLLHAIEYSLFENNGQNFLDWKDDHCWYLESQVEAVERALLKWSDSEDEEIAKKEIVRKLKEIIE